MHVGKTMTNKSHVSKQLARQASRAIAAYRHADATRAPTVPHADRLSALSGEASFHPCGSQEGAVFQLCAAWGQAANAIEAGDPTDADLRCLNRLFGNVLCYLEEGGASAADLGFAGFYFWEEKPAAANENRSWNRGASDVG